MALLLLMSNYLENKFHEYVNDLCNQKSLNNQMKIFEKLFLKDKDYALAFSQYVKEIRCHFTDHEINKKLEGDFFAEFIW